MRVRLGCLTTRFLVRASPFLRIRTAVTLIEPVLRSNRATRRVTCRRSRKRSRDHDRNEGKEPSNWLAPFHRIWTPMHTSRKAESLIITFMPVGPMIAPSRSANA